MRSTTLQSPRRSTQLSAKTFLRIRTAFISFTSILQAKPTKSSKDFLQLIESIHTQKHPNFLTSVLATRSTPSQRTDIALHYKSFLIFYSVAKKLWRWLNRSANWIQMRTLFVLAPNYLRTPGSNGAVTHMKPAQSHAQAYHSANSFTWLRKNLTWQMIQFSPRCSQEGKRENKPRIRIRIVELTELRKSTPQGNLVQSTQSPSVHFARGTTH